WWRVMVVRIDSSKSGRLFGIPADKGPMRYFVVEPMAIEAMSALMLDAICLLGPLRTLHLPRSGVEPFRIFDYLSQLQAVLMSHVIQSDNFCPQPTPAYWWRIFFTE